MISTAFNNTIDIWIKELGHYNVNQLCSKPSPGSWSLGQVYVHLADNTDYFLEQAEICASANDNADEEASPFAKVMFLTDEFPDEVLEGPPENSVTLQPGSKEELMDSLINLKAKINDIADLISKSSFKGKTKHPGLNYFNAAEWLQFAEMHFRHHLRQKKRIDKFLKQQYSTRSN